MRRNKAPPPQDKMSNNNNNLNQYSDLVDDSTPNRIRPRTTDMKNTNTNRSRYEIDHGSSDYNPHIITSNSPLIIDDSQLRADSPGSHSSKDGLHHRKSHHLNANNQHPIQHLSHPLATNNTNNQQSSSLVHHNSRNSQQRGRIKSNNHLPSHLVQRSRSSVGNNNSQKVIWKKVIQCIFIV